MQNQKDAGSLDEEDTEGWIEDIKSYVLCGFFREKKVFFSRKEMEFRSPVYKRIVLHMKSCKSEGLKYDLDAKDQRIVENWWDTEAKQVLHKKMMEKKSNCLTQMRKAMLGEMICCYSLCITC